jgi:glycosyltransferase involved in cell wall biosynthesis
MGLGGPILYMSYDGALEPLGRSQVVPYLVGLAARGASVTLMSFEKPADLAGAERARLRDELARAGVRWIPLVYHKRPTLAATAWDLACGTVVAATVVIRSRIGIVHARSYVVALIAWLLKRTLGVRFVFDMRGFWPDERVEGGLWRRGRVYRVVKWLERRFLRDADEVVTLTERARATVEHWDGLTAPHVTVIPTCVDLARFRVAPRRARAGGRTLVYTGSLGTWYELPAMLRFAELASERAGSVRFVVVTRNLDEVERVRAATRLGRDQLVAVSAAPAEVPRWLAEADAGLAFYKPGWARQATCPTKVGEYLATGLPVVVNDAVGDMAAIVGGSRAGVVLSEFSDAALTAALDALDDLLRDPDVTARCRRVAETHFSLEEGVERYAAIYRRLA